MIVSKYSQCKKHYFKTLNSRNLLQQDRRKLFKFVQLLPIRVGIRLAFHGIKL